MQENLSITLKVNEETLKKMLDFYEPFKEEPPQPSMILFARGEGVNVSIYAKKNGLSTVLFQGPNSLEEARLFDPKAAPNAKKAVSQNGPMRNLYPQIGSDEVGTGDFFGPMVVVASFVRKEDLPLLEELGVTDSKKMDDEYILSIGPRLIHSFDYSSLCLPPTKFNLVHDALNMNALKAKMHNRCLLNLKAKHPEAHAYMDQFAAPPLYYSYLKSEKETLRGISFSCKGEVHFPSVALGSVIARYSFLRKMQAMNEKYGLVFPLGAGKEVDAFLEEYLRSHSEKELSEVGKLSFKNYTKLL